MVSNRFGDWYSDCQVGSTSEEGIPRESSADAPTIAFRRTLFLGNAIRLHETELWIEQRTCAHCSKMSLSESTSNPTSLQPFLIFILYRQRWKNEEFRIFSVKYVLRVIRFGLKSLVEELAENQTMKLKIKYNSDDNTHAF